jgi:hypothetical protein
VFTNITYAGPAPAITSAYLELAKTGGLKPRTLTVAPALLDMQQAVTELYETWSDEGIRAITTDTFFMDMPLEKRREQVTGLRAALGKCRAITPFEPENALRGRWTLKCSSGSLEAWITLAPTVPPKMQVLEFKAALRLSPALKAAANALARLIREWDAEAANAALGRSVKREALRAQFEALRAQYGALRLGDTLESDGATFAVVRLLGKNGGVDMKLVIDPKAGKVREITFTRPRETMFVP